MPNNNNTTPIHSLGAHPLGQILRDLEHIYDLALAQKKLSNALRAKELIAKITGLLRPVGSHKKELLHLHELSDEQVQLLINEAEEMVGKEALVLPE